MRVNIKPGRDSNIHYTTFDIFDIKLEKRACHMSHVLSSPAYQALSSTRGCCMHVHPA